MNQNRDDDLTPYHFDHVHTPFTFHIIFLLLTRLNPAFLINPTATARLGHPIGVARPKQKCPIKCMPIISRRKKRQKFAILAFTDPFQFFPWL